MHDAATKYAAIKSDFCLCAGNSESDSIRNHISRSARGHGVRDESCMLIGIHTLPLLVSYIDLVAPGPTICSNHVIVNCNIQD